MARDRRDIARKDGAAQTAAAASAPSADSTDKALARNHEPPHPDLVRLVQLLARHVALADIAAQKAAHRPKE